MVPKSQENGQSSLGSDTLIFELVLLVTPSSSNIPFLERQQSQILSSLSPVAQSIWPSM